MVLEANQKGSITLESDVWDDNQVRKHATIRLHQLSKDHELRKFLISYFKDRMNSYRKEMIEILEVE